MGMTPRAFAHRMFIYFYRMLDKYQKPVTAYAIFTGASRAGKPNSFATNYISTSLGNTLNTYAIAGRDDEELQASNIRASE